MSRQAIRFAAKVEAVQGRALLRLPERASRKLPSRGQVAVRGSINGVDFDTVVEPDGRFGHWIRVGEALRRRARVDVGDTAALDIEPAEEWPEPSVPKDLAEVLDEAPARIQELWHEITPMARWEWVRWIDATSNPGTRRRRLEVSISKMQSGKRRPCCFNLASCTDPELSRSGRLIDPA